MTKREKLIERFLSKPKDFNWNELVNILNNFGYEQSGVGKTGGSRARFIRANSPPITLHKPHPKPILKKYQIDAIIDTLKEEKLL